MTAARLVIVRYLPWSSSWMFSLNCEQLELRILTVAHCSVSEVMFTTKKWTDGDTFSQLKKNH